MAAKVGAANWAIGFLRHSDPPVHDDCSVEILLDARHHTTHHPGNAKGDSLIRPHFSPAASYRVEWSHACRIAILVADLDRAPRCPAFAADAGRDDRARLGR